MSGTRSSDDIHHAFDLAKAALRGSGHYDLRLEAVFSSTATIVAFLDPNGPPDPVRIGGRMKAVVDRVLEESGLSVIDSEDGVDSEIVFTAVIGKSYEGLVDRVLVGVDEIHVTIARDPQKPISGHQIETPSIVHRVALQRDETRVSKMMTRSGDRIMIVYPADTPTLAVMVNHSTRHLRIRS